MDYENPFGQLPDPNFVSKTAGGLMGMMAARGNYDTALPFLQNALERNNASTAESVMKSGEFTSPQAIQARELASRLQMGQNQNALALLPDQHKVAQNALTGQIEDFPQQRELQRAALGNQVMTEKAKPHQIMEQRLGAMGNLLRSLPGGMRASEYKNGMARLRQEFPGLQIPQGYEEYTPQVAQELDALGIGQVNTPDHVRKMDEIGQQGQWHRYNTDAQVKIHADANVSRERIAAANREAINARTAGKEPTSWAGLLAKYIGIAQDPDSSPEEREMASQVVAQLQVKAKQDAVTKAQRADADYQSIEKDLARAQWFKNPDKPNEAAELRAKLEARRKQIEAEVEGKFSISKTPTKSSVDMPKPIGWQEGDEIMSGEGADRITPAMDNAAKANGLDPKDVVWVRRPGESKPRPLPKRKEK